jgi:predicted Zn-ribbon and HTH transcriptional regulator
VALPVRKAKCRECGIEIEKEKIDIWNIRKLYSRYDQESNCPVCLSRKDLDIKH